jgi:hypothetical protein
MRFFNTAGPCKPDMHYMLPAADRLPGVPRTIDRQGYFVIHGPRQSGKTTAMLELAKQLTAAGGWTSVCATAPTPWRWNSRSGATTSAIP